MKRRNLIFALTMAAIVAILAGCSNHDGNEWQRLVCEVENSRLQTLTGASVFQT